MVLFVKCLYDLSVLVSCVFCVLWVLFLICWFYCFFWIEVKNGVFLVFGFFSSFVKFFFWKVWIYLLILLLFIFRNLVIWVWECLFLKWVRVSNFFYLNGFLLISKFFDVDILGWFVVYKFVYWIILIRLCFI